MDIDWVATGTMLTGIGTISSAIAIAFAAWIGKTTIRDLRRDRAAQRQFEVADLVYVRSQLIFYRLSRLMEQSTSSAARFAETERVSSKEFSEVLKGIQPEIEALSQEMDGLLKLIPDVIGHLSFDTASVMNDFGRLGREFFEAMSKGYVKTNDKHAWYALHEGLEPLGEALKDQNKRLSALLEPYFVTR